MTYHPGRIANSLETIGQEMAHWCYATKETLSTASYEMRQADEALAQAEKQEKITANQLANDQEAANKAQIALTKAVDLCRAQLALSQKALSEAHRVYDEAKKTLEYWKSELSKAQAWLERALQRLATAKAALQAAQARLAHAVSTLRNAEAALHSCNNDDSRRSCRGEESAVYRARSQVTAAQQEVYVAQQEVQAAEEEVAQARARVAACKRAVGFAEQALNVAHKAKETAQQGVNHAERSLEHTTASSKEMQKAQIALDSEEKAVEATIAAVTTANTSCAEARNHLKNAEYYEQGAQHAAMGARYDIEGKVRTLREVDRANLFDAIKLGITTGITVISFLISSPRDNPHFRTHDPHLDNVIHKMEQAKKAEEAVDAANELLEKRQENLDRIRHPEKYSSGN